MSLGVLFAVVLPLWFWLTLVQPRRAGLGMDKVLGRRKLHQGLCNSSGRGCPRQQR